MVCEDEKIEFQKPVKKDFLSFVLLKERLFQAFFPTSVQTSVDPSFLPYCKWQFAHMVSGTMTGVLSMQALLFAIGLGAGALPVAAAMNWVLKDGLGQVSFTAS